MIICIDFRYMANIDLEYDEYKYSLWTKDPNN